MRNLEVHVDEVNDNDHDNEGENKALLGLKIMFIFVMMIATYFGLIPAYSKKCRSHTIILSLMNCFAGGLFLSMAFVHILPEAAESYNEAMSSDSTDVSEHHDALRRILREGRFLNETLAESITISSGEEGGHGKIFPLPYLLYFVGYCLVLFIDRVVAGHYSHNHERLSAGGIPCPEHQIKSA